LGKEVQKGPVLFLQVFFVWKFLVRWTQNQKWFWVVKIVGTLLDDKRNLFEQKPIQGSSCMDWQLWVMKLKPLLFEKVSLFVHWKASLELNLRFWVLGFEVLQELKSLFLETPSAVLFRVCSCNGWYLYNCQRKGNCLQLSFGLSKVLWFFIDSMIFIFSNSSVTTCNKPLWDLSSVFCPA
jgi:hypothetical protein